MRQLLIAVLITLLAASCASRDADFKAAHSFSGKNWHKDSLISFNFEISETAPVRNLIFSARTGSKYPYANIYYRYSLYGPDSVLLESKLQQFFVAGPSTGKPIGRTVGDMVETDALAIDNYRFNRPGKYRLTIAHYMRDSILQEVDAFSVLVKSIK